MKKSMHCTTTVKRLRDKARVKIISFIHIPLLKEPVVPLSYFMIQKMKITKLLEYTFDEIKNVNTKKLVFF
jgi:hypothetical protein